MSEYLIQDATLTNLGNQVRIACGSTNTMTPNAMTNNLTTFNTEMYTAIGEQDSLITQIFAALEGKAGGGSNVIVGEITQSSSNPSIVISNAIGKDNVVLMYMDTGDYQASAMADAGLGNVIVHGESHSYTIMYADGLYAYSDDGFIEYNNTTGTVSIASNMRYNETFIAGHYVYVTW